MSVPVHPEIPGRWTRRWKEGDTCLHKLWSRKIGFIVFLLWCFTSIRSQNPRKCDSISPLISQSSSNNSSSGLMASGPASDMYRIGLLLCKWVGIRWKSCLETNTHTVTDPSIRPSASVWGWEEEGEGRQTEGKHLTRSSRETERSGWRSNLMPGWHGFYSQTDPGR